MERISGITFADLANSALGGFIRIVYNGRTVYDGTGEGLYIEGNLIEDNFVEAFRQFVERYSKKQIYSFYCVVVHLHHTELLIEGE